MAALWCGGWWWTVRAHHHARSCDCCWCLVPFPVQGVSVSHRVSQVSTSAQPTVSRYAEHCHAVARCAVFAAFWCALRRCTALCYAVPAVLS